MHSSSMKGRTTSRMARDKLVTDLNAALANAKLDTLIRAEGDGAKVSFVAIDPAITAFTVSKGPGDDDAPPSDGFEELGITSPTAASLVGGVLKVVASLPGPLLGQLLGEMAVIRFNITRNGSSKDTDVTLLKTATTDNKGIGDDQPKLLDADNAPTFANAQELADRLTEILSSFLPGSVHYNATDKVLTYDVSFTDVKLFSVELPVDFELDLSPVGNIASNTRLIIDATGGINFTLGFDISANPPASSGALADGTAFGDLNVPVTVKLEEAASADSTPRTLVGQLSGDATFTISYNPTGMLTVPALTAGVAGTDINVTKRANDQSETAIAVNPVDPDNIIIGANDLNTPTIDSVWVTHDGGAIWNIVTIPNTIGGNGNSAGDPALVFSRDGSVVIYTHMIEKTNGDTVIVSVRSINGGNTWIDERVIGSLALDEDGDTIDDSNDKNYIAVGPDVNDLTSDRFIITWQRHNVIYASTSTDNGLVWTAPVVVGGLLAGKGSPVAEPSGSSIDAIPSFGPDGEIYVAWEDFGDASDGVSRIKFDSSLDGGVTWGGGVDRTVYWDTSDFLISDLSLADQAKLDNVAAAMIANPLLIATIAGYTDRAGDPGPNQTLSDNRADAVFTYLNITKGIAASRLTKLGFGETHLAVSTLDGVANAANRRVEVTLDEVIYTGYVNVFRDPFDTSGVAGTGLDTVDETTSPAGLGEYEIPGQDTRGIWMGLSMDVYLSGSAHEGRIYLAFADQGDLDGNADSANPTDHHNTDIFIIASDDDGVTWDALALSPDAEGADQVQVNDDIGTASQWFAWLDVDQSTGAVAVSWYDTRNDTGASVDADTDALTNTGVQYFAAISRDFGLTWDDNIQVSDGTSNVTNAVAGPGTAANQFGDYSALAFNNSTIYMAWADNSNSTLDHVPAWPASLSTEVYFDTIDLTNQTFQDLLDDINFALAGVTVGDGPDADASPDVLGDKFQAQAAAPGSNTVKIVALDPTITSFTVTVENTNDPAFRDLGFQLSSTAVNEGGTLVVKGAKNVPTIVGQLTADASFDIDLDGVGLGLPVTVTVQRADTVSDFAPNRNILDLVFDVQKAIDNSTIGAGVIKVSSDHGRLLFTRLGTPVLGDGDEFTITPGANADELGITGTLTSDEADIVITESDGVTQHRIVLDGVTTIGGLITAINTQSGGAITASKTTDDPDNAGE